MKFNLGSVLSAALVASMITTPLTPLTASETTAPRDVRHIALVMLHDIEATSAKILEKVDSKVLNALDLEKTAAAKKEIAEQIAATLKSDAEVENLRSEAREAAISEAKRAKTDLISKISLASTETLDRYAEQMKTNPAYSDLSTEYAGAFTQSEKSRILTQVVIQDLDQVLTMTLKRLNWLNAEGLRSDLKSLEARVFGGKGDGAKIKRILLIAGAAVAFVGLATWGVASSKYAKIRNERRDVLEGEFQKLRSELQAVRDTLAASQKAELDTLVAKLTKNYNELNSKLTKEELDFLKTNGYVRMQCNSYTQNSSIICNKYGYQVFRGTTTCSVMCYKNVLLNRETLFEAPVCFSSYIPSDCFSQAMYDAEYNQGYNRGYNDKEPVGERDGRNQGNTDGAKDGAEDGDDDGYDDGKADGKADGYDDAYYKAYNAGYKERYNLGYEDGYDVGFDDGYADGYSDGLPSTATGFISLGINSVSSAKTLDLNEKPLFKKGYDDGLRDSKLLLSFQMEKGA